MISQVREYLGRTGLRTILLKALVGSAGLRVIGMFFGFLVGVQLARGLGPANYGLYGTAMAVIAVLMVPTELGLPTLVVREVAAAKVHGRPGTMEGIVRWAVRWVILTSLLISGVVATVLYFDAFLGHEGIAIVLAFGLLWIPTVAIGNIYAAALRGSQHFIAGQVGELLIRPVAISAFLFLISLGLISNLTPVLAMLLNVLAATIALAYSYFLLKRSSSYSAASHGGCDLSISAALPMGMSEGMRVLAGQLGILILGFSVAPEQVGIYRVAFGIYTVTTMPSALINAVCSPILSRLHNEGRMKELVQLNFLISAILISSSLICLVMFLFFGEPVLAAIFGYEYLPAVEILIIFMAGEVVASLFGHPTVVLNMLRKQRVVMWWSGIALAVNALTTWWLVGTIGYTGAAFGSVFGLILWRAGCAFYSKLRLGVDTTPLTMLLRPAVRTPGV